MAEPRPCGPILVVDDDARLREFLCTLLSDAGFDVVAAATGEEALREASVTPPRAAIVDVCLPWLSGYEVCRTLKQRNPEPIVVFISGQRVEPFDRVGGLLIGADDYLVKPFAPDELLARLRGLLRRDATSRLPRPSSGLTLRELEVLGWLTRGLAPAEIAEQLVISRKTVGTHVEHIFRKLDVRSRAQAVAAAYRLGLVPVEPDVDELTA